MIKHIQAFVFSTQFFFALLCFNIPFSTELFLWIWITYFAVTLTPSLFFGKIIVRDSIAVAIFSIGGYEALPVLLSSFSIWIINVFTPTLIAWKKIKLNRMYSVLTYLIIHACFMFLFVLTGAILQFLKERKRKGNNKIRLGI